MDIPKEDGTYKFDGSELVPVVWSEGYFVAYKPYTGQEISVGQLIGVWTSPDDGVQTVDKVSWHGSRHMAEAHGRRCSQLAIWDIKAGQEIWL